MSSQLKATFDAMDYNNDGIITIDDLKKSAHGFNIRDDEIEFVFNEMDIAKTGKINYDTYETYCSKVNH